MEGAVFADGLNLPEVGQPTPAGRLMAFPSSKGMTWFLASGLSSTMDCTPAPQGVLNRVCTVRVYNTVTDEEVNALKALTPSWAQYNGFRDFNSNIVSSIDDRFESLSGELATGSPMYMKTLGISNQAPYASMMVRVGVREGESLLNSYQNEGVGEFVSEVEIQGEWTETYLALHGVAPIQQVLNRCHNSGGMKGSVLKQALKDAIAQTTLAREGLEPDEARAIALDHLLENFFVLDGRNHYQVKLNHGADVVEGWVVVDETYSPTPMRCKAVLPLKKGAVGTVTCALEGAT
jgi:hypothetical protein